MDSTYVHWDAIRGHINIASIDLNSRIVIMDQEGKEHFCTLDWIQEDGFQRPVLVIEKED